MRVLLVWLCAVATAVAANTPSVVYDTEDLTGAALPNARVVIQPLNIVARDGRITALIPRTNTTDGAGAFTTAMVPNDYRVRIHHGLFTTTFTNCIPDVSGTINASDYICTATNVAGTLAYSQAGANARFMLKTNASGALQHAGMSNILIRPRFFAGLGPTNGTTTSNYVWTLTNYTTGEGEWRENVGGGGGGDVTTAMLTNHVNSVSNINWQAFPTFDWYTFGARVTNTVAANDLAWSNMVMTWHANGGGRLRVAQNLRTDDAGPTNSGWWLPDNGGSPQYHFPALIEGGGAENNWVFNPRGGTPVWFTGTNTNNAAIFLAGYGNVEIKGVNIMADAALSNQWLLKAVFSRVKLHENYFGGAGAGGTNSYTDALQFGNSIHGQPFNYTNAYLPNAHAQGYQSIIANNDFGKIRTVIELNQAANHFVFRENGVKFNSGGNAPMIIVQTNAGVDTTSGNSFLFNTFEGTGYHAPLVRLNGATYTRFLGNGWYDPLGGGLVQSVFEFTNNPSNITIDENLISQGFNKWVHGPPSALTGVRWETAEQGETNFLNNIFRHSSHFIMSGNDAHLRWRIGTDTSPTDMYFQPSASGIIFKRSLPGADPENAFSLSRAATNNWTFAFGPTEGTSALLLGGSNLNIRSRGPIGTTDGDINLGWNTALPGNFLRISPLENGSIFLRASNNAISLPNGAAIAWTADPNPDSARVVRLKGIDGELWTISGTGTTKGTNRSATDYIDYVRVQKGFFQTTNANPRPVEEGTFQLWFNPVDTNVYVVVPDGSGGTNISPITTNVLSGYLKDKDESFTNFVGHGTGSTPALHVVGQAGASARIDHLGHIVVSNGQFVAIANSPESGGILLQDTMSLSNRTRIVGTTTGVRFWISPSADVDGSGNATNYQAATLLKNDGDTTTFSLDGAGENRLISGGHLDLWAWDGMNVRIANRTNSGAAVVFSPWSDVSGVRGQTNTGPFRAASFAATAGGNIADPNGNLYVTNSTGIDGGAGGGSSFSLTNVTAVSTNFHINTGVGATDYSITLTADSGITITTASDGQPILVRVIQGAGGNHLINWTNMFSGSLDALSVPPNLTTNENAVNYYRFKFYDPDDEWHFVGEGPGYGL